MQWGIESVAATAMQASPLETGSIEINAPAGASTPGMFANLIQGELGDLNHNIAAAETAMSDMAAGKEVQLHEAMIGLERARISVQVFVQVRNKLVESYQDLMRMNL